MSNLLRHLGWRMLRYVVVLLVLASGIRCSDSFHPGLIVKGSIDIQPLLVAAQTQPIPLDSFVVELRRVSDSTVAFSKTVRADSGIVSVAADSVTIDLEVPLQRDIEEFYLHIRIVGAGIVWFEVTDTVTIRADRPTTTPPLLPLFVGPGADGTSVAISLNDTTITGGDSVLVWGTVFRSTTVIDSAPVGFESSDSLLASVRQVGLNEAWVKPVRAATDSVTITARAPTRDIPLTEIGTLRFFARPDRLIEVSGDNQSVLVSEVAQAPLVVQVLDAAGDPFTRGYPVSFQITSAPANTAVSPTSTVTDASGFAQTILTAGDAAGTAQVSASAANLTGSPVNFTATVTGGVVPNLLFIVSGDGQTADTSATLPLPIVVGVVDPADNPVPGEQVVWTPSHGTVNPNTSITDAGGQTQTVWTLGNAPGTQTLTAAISGASPVIISATATVPLSQQMTIAAGNGQAATVATALPVNPAVLVTDGASNPVVDVPVTFAVATGGGSATGTTTVTDADGIATVGSWTLGQAAGQNTLTATATGLTPVTFTATGTPDVADAVVVISGNGQTADAGTDLPAPLVVEVQDQYGNAVPNVQVAWAALHGSVTPTSSQTTANGRAQTVWTLGSNTVTQTATATVANLTPAVFTATASFQTPTILLSLLGTNRIALGRSADLQVTLSEPAPTGGVTVTVTSDNTGIVTVRSPGTVSIPQGQSAGIIALDGVSIGTTTVRGNATNHTEGTLQVDVSAQVLSLPTTLNVPYGGTASMPIQISTPAPAGGEVVTLLSSDPSIVSIQTPTVTIAAGSQTANATVAGVTPGTVTVTGNSTTYGSAQSAVSATANLNITQTSVRLNASFTSDITVQLESGGSLIAAPAPGVTVTLAPADPACVAATSPITIPTGLVSATATLSYGGSATLRCTSWVVASAPNIAPDSINATVDTTPGISVPAMGTVGASLQNGWFYGYLDASNHPGVTVRLTSGNPAVALLAPNSTTPGTAFLDLPVAAGATSFTYWVQGADGATPGAVTITASAPNFADGSNTVTVVTPAFQLAGLPVSTTSFSNDDPFQVQVGVPNAGQTALSYTLPLRAGAPTLTFDITNSDANVAQLVTTAQTGQSASVQIVAGQSQSPSSVAAGGVAFDPKGPGPATVTATLQAGTFIKLPTATRTVDVTAPGITVPGMGTVGASLQNGWFYGYLDAPNHPGVTVRLTSGDPAVALLAPNATTPGTAFIDLPVAAGATSFSYWVQGADGATPGAVTITASAPGFDNGSNTVTVVTPAFQIAGLPISTTSLSNDDPFEVQVGVPNTQQTALSYALPLRAGGPTLTFDVTNSVSNVAQLVTTAQTGQSVSVQIAAGQSHSPSSVAAGGVAFDPDGPGATTVTATLQAGTFIQLPTATRTVDVTAPGITVPGMGTVGASLQNGWFYGYLDASNHPGVTVRLTSGDPAVALLAPNATTPGTAFIDIPVAAGATSFSYWVQGADGATPGAVTITASAPGFDNGSNTVTVVTPAFQIAGLPISTTSLSNDDPFEVQVGVPNTQQTALSYALPLRAGATTLTFDVANSVGNVGQLVTTAQTGQAVSVQIAAEQSRSPSSVAAGGVAFRPVGAGTTSVSATLQTGGFIQLPTATRAVDVTTPGITVPAMGTVGAGLQNGSFFGYLGAPNHGGVTVRLTSSNPSVALLSTRSDTAGTAFIDIRLLNGATGFGYYVQGADGATPGTVTITATATGFIDGSNTVNVVTPALDIIGLVSSKSQSDPDDPFQVRLGVPNANQTAISFELPLRAGASPLVVAIDNSNPAAARLVTTALTGQAVTVQVNPGQARSPSGVSSGGVAFDPLAPGATDVSATAPGYIILPNATITVNISP